MDALSEAAYSYGVGRGVADKSLEEEIAELRRKLRDRSLIEEEIRSRFDNIPAEYRAMLAGVDMGENIDEQIDARIEEIKKEIESKRAELAKLAVEAREKNVECLIALAYEHMESGEADEAEKATKEATEIGVPDRTIQARAHKVLAGVYNRKGDVKSAIAEFEKAHACDPSLNLPGFALFGEALPGISTGEADESLTEDDAVLSGLKDQGKILINSPRPAASFNALSRFCLYTVDAYGIAEDKGLVLPGGMPVINTTLLGAAQETPQCALTHKKSQLDTWLQACTQQTTYTQTPHGQWRS